MMIINLASTLFLLPWVLGSWIFFSLFFLFYSFFFFLLCILQPGCHNKCCTEAKKKRKVKVIKSGQRNLWFITILRLFSCDNDTGVIVANLHLAVTLSWSWPRLFKNTVPCFISSSDKILCFNAWWEASYTFSFFFVCAVSIYVTQNVASLESPHHLYNWVHHCTRLAEIGCNAVGLVVNSSLVWHDQSPWFNILRWLT